MKRTILMLLLFSFLGVNAQLNRNFNVFKETKSENKNERIALVIANADYKHGKLEKPVEEAQHMVDALNEQGFDVLVGYNLDYLNMKQTVIDFSKKYPLYKEGLVYYAGHGFQIDGQNYLVPVDTPQTEVLFELKSALVNVDYIFEAINDPNKPKLVIMDACRNNPFKEKLSAKFRSSDQSGFSEIRHLVNSMMLFSTGPGTKVSDENPFTKILSEEIKVGGCFDDITRRVNDRIRGENPKQIITIKGFLQEEFCFGEEKKDKPTPPEPVEDVEDDSNNKSNPKKDIIALNDVLSWMQGKITGIKFDKYYNNGMLSKNYWRKSSYTMEYDASSCDVKIIEVESYVEDRNSYRNDVETTLTYEFNLADIGSIEVESKYYGQDFLIKGYNGQEVIKESNSNSSTKYIRKEISLRFNELGDLEGEPERFLKAFNDARRLCGAKTEKY